MQIIAKDVRSLKSLVEEKLRKVGTQKKSKGKEEMSYLLPDKDYSVSIMIVENIADGAPHVYIQCRISNGKIVKSDSKHGWDNKSSRMSISAAQDYMYDWTLNTMDVLFGKR